MDLLTPGGMGGSGNSYQGGHAVTPNATEDDLLDALESMERGDIEYVIVQDDRNDLSMQAAGDARSGYVLEYVSGDAGTIMAARGNVTGTLLTEILAAFLNRDAAWRTKVTWEQRA